MQQVLQERHARFRKAPTYEILGKVLGDGVLTSEGDVWLRHRRLARPAFHRRVVEGFGPLIVEATERMVDLWKDRGAREVDIAHELRELTLEIVGQALFSRSLADLAHRIGADLDEVLEYARIRFASVLGPHVYPPTPSYRRFLRAKADLDEVTRMLVRERAALGAHAHDDLLGLLGRRRGRGRAAQRDRAPRRSAHVRARGARDPRRTPSPGACCASASMPARVSASRRRPTRCRSPPRRMRRWAGRRAVLDETMRLHPPAWVVERAPIESDDLDGHPVDSRDAVMLPQWVVHRRPELWDAPLSFRPERFADGGKPTHRYAYFPFGGGPRLCIGAPPALLEGRLILSVLARRVRLDPVPGYPVVAEPAITLRPPHGLRTLVTHR